MEEYLNRLYITQDGEPESIHDSVENVSDVIEDACIDILEYMLENVILFNKWSRKTTTSDQCVKQFLTKKENE